MSFRSEKFQSFIKKIVPKMSQEEMDAFSSKAKELKFHKGELFMTEGKICRRLLFVHQGLFRYYIQHEGFDFTKDFAVDTQNPFCTAYTSFMLQIPSEIFIEALEPCEVWFWDRSDVLPFFEDHPVWLGFAKKMADQLIFRKDRKELEVIKCSAEERYRNFLVNFPGLSQRVPQYHIATYLGITPESLSRIRSKITKSS